MVVSPLSTSSEGSLICVKLYPQLLSEQNKLDLKSFKDKLPPNIEEYPIFQHLSRYPTSVHVFPDPIHFLAGLKPSWEHGQQRHAIMAGEKADSGEPNPELFVVHTWIGSLLRIKDRKCKTRRGSSRPPVKRKLASRSSTSRATHAKTSSLKDDAPFLIVFDDDEGLPNVLELKDVNACHLKISAITLPTWKNHLDNHIYLELLDLYDHCYARQVVVDNVANRRSRKLLQVIKKIRGECNVMRSRERARDEECEGLRVKCEAAMTDFEKNPTVVALREKISSLSTKAKEHKASRHVAGIKNPFNLSKVKGYRFSYKKDHTRASNNLATATFPWLDEFVTDPSAPIKALLSKKPPTLQRPAPLRTQVSLVSS
ncbi:hypothetical protein Tco_0144063 [Tanacetum coccineum]